MYSFHMLTESKNKYEIINELALSKNLVFHFYYENIVGKLDSKLCKNELFNSNIKKYINNEYKKFINYE